MLSHETIEKLLSKVCPNCNNFSIEYDRDNNILFCKCCNFIQNYVDYKICRESYKKDADKYIAIYYHKISKK